MVASRKSSRLTRRGASLALIVNGQRGLLPTIQSYRIANISPEQGTIEYQHRVSLIENDSVQFGKFSPPSNS